MDYEKVKDALLPCLVRPRNTEKASAVLDEGADSRKTADAADTVAPPPGGHGRNGTQGFVGAQKVEIAHQHLNHGDRRPECGEGNVHGQREPKVLVRIVGQAPLAATVYSLERCVALPVGRHLQRKSWKPSRPSTRVFPRRRQPSSTFIQETPGVRPRN